MTFEEFKDEVAGRIEYEQNKINNSYSGSGRKNKEFYIAEGMLTAYQIIEDLLEDVEVGV